MRVALACDHNGFAYKAPMIRALEADGHTVADLGTSSDAPADYPDFAYAVGTAVRDGRADLGVLICGSGAGVAIAANKLRGVRAAVCHDLFTARQSREDDDANDHRGNIDTCLVFPDQFARAIGLQRRDVLLGVAAAREDAETAARHGAEASRGQHQHDPLRPGVGAHDCEREHPRTRRRRGLLGKPSLSVLSQPGLA